MVELIFLMVGLSFCACVILSLITINNNHAHYERLVEKINKYMNHENENDFEKLNKRIKELEDEVRDMAGGYNCGGWHD